MGVSGALFTTCSTSTCLTVKVTECDGAWCVAVTANTCEALLAATDAKHENSRSAGSFSTH